MSPAVHAPSRPRVLMVGPLPPPVGGMATVIENLSSALAGQLELKVLNNVKTTAPDRPLWVGIASQLGLLARLAWDCIAWRPALVHIHTCSWWSFWRSGVDCLIARLLRRRVVLHIHGAQFRTFLGGLSPRSAWLARRVLALADRVLVLGELWREALADWTDPKRIAVVQNGVPIPEPVTLAEEGPFRILTLANYERRKGQEDLLRAAAALKGPREVRVELLGFESEPGRQQALIELADRLGMADRVDVPGPMVGEAKEGRLRRASCFCLPSYDEGLPMAMLEAMAAGLPCVVTRVGSIPEAVADGHEGLLYTAGDVPELTARLQSLLDDPAHAASIARAGRERVRRDFGIERSAQTLLGLYDGLGVSVPRGQSLASTQESGVAKDPRL